MEKLVGHSRVIRAPQGGHRRQATRPGDDQALAGQGPEHGRVGEAGGVTAAHDRMADMEMVAVRLGQKAERHVAVGIGRAGEVGQARKLLQQSQSLCLQGIEFQGIWSIGHGSGLPFFLALAAAEPSELAQAGQGSGRAMNVTLARRLVSLAQRAYARLGSSRAEAWRPRHVDAFTTPAFTGFVASDDHAAYLVFRGTKLDHDNGDLFQRTLQAWLANLDFAQVEEHGAMVHRGYARELDGVSELLLEMARDHALGGKPLYVTGHSAGGALATLAARRLHAAGAPVRAALVFSAPRVGDRRFAASYRYRCCGSSTGTILIPHLPLPPSLARCWAGA